MCLLGIFEVGQELTAMITILSAYRFLLCSLIGGIGIAGLADRVYSQANVLIFSSGDPDKDNALGKLIEGYGHKVIIGSELPDYAGGGLSGVHVVLLQASQSWADKDMPESGQLDLLNFVNSGGGLITTRPVLWNTAEGSELSALRNAFPAEPESSTPSGQPVTYAQNSLDKVLNAGLPAYFSIHSASDVDGQTVFAPRPGAKVFFQSNSGGTGYQVAGVVGWNYGAGRVIALSTLLDEVSLQDANYSRLVHNSIVWTKPIPEPSAGLCALLATVGTSLYRRRR